MAADTLTESKVDWSFVYKTLSRQSKKQFSCLIMGEPPLFRIPLEKQLASYPDIHLITPQTALESAKQESPVPDLILLKINITLNNPIKIVQNLKKRYPEILILAIGRYTEPNIIRRIFMAGVNGYLMEDSLFVHLEEALQSVLSGKIYITNHLFSALLENILVEQHNPLAREECIAQLSEKEFEIFLLVGRGYKNQAIVRETCFSLSSIVTYIRNIRMHLNFKTTRELANFAKNWIKTHVEVQSKN